MLIVLGIKYDAEKEAKAAEAAKQAELLRIEEAKSKVAEKSIHVYFLLIPIIFNLLFLYFFMTLLSNFCISTSVADNFNNLQKA